MATGSTEPFHLLEEIVDPRTGKANPITSMPDVDEVCINGLPWGGEQSTEHVPGPDEEFYDDHYQAH